MLRYCYFLEGGLLLLATFSHGFAPVGRWKPPVVSPLGLIDTTGLKASDEIPISPSSNLVKEKHFQLEELEDAERCTTDILLNSDWTLTVGKTDGPLFQLSYGSWSVDDSLDDRAVFEMKLSRTFIAGGNSKDATAITEFDYEVERTYNGLLTVVGGSLVAVEGAILDVDELFGTRQVGFFNMIDTTAARVVDSVQ